MNDPRPHDRLAREPLRPLVDELARRYGDGREPHAVTLRDLSLEARRARAPVA